MINLSEWANSQGIDKTTASKLLHRKLIAPAPTLESEDEAKSHKGRRRYKVAENAIRLPGKVGRPMGWRKYTVIKKIYNVLPY